jgi:hypothetical protein
MVPIHTGNCPKCGAAVWSQPDPTNPMAIPSTVFTCACRDKVEIQPLYPWIYPLTFPLPQPTHPSPQPFYPYITPTWIGDGMPDRGSSTCKLPGNVSVYTSPTTSSGSAGVSGKVEE